MAVDTKSLDYPAFGAMLRKRMSERGMTLKAPPTKGKKIFISYSHKDHEYLERLMVHLKPLEKQGLIEAWADTKLLAGDKWKKEIEQLSREQKLVF